MEQTRNSVLKAFPKLERESLQPYVIYINGQPEWVDNYITFGDLIEEHMGKEARDFYFENLYDLLSFAKNGGYFDDPDDIPPLIKEFLANAQKAQVKQQRKKRVESKRLF